MHILFYRPTVTNDGVIPMSTNVIYQGNISQDFHNPAYIETSKIYDEIPGGQYEELSEVKETNLHSNDDANQDNESYVSQVNQQDQDDRSYVNKRDQDIETCVSQVNQHDQDNNDTVDTAQIQDQKSYENIPKLDSED